MTVTPKLLLITALVAGIPLSINLAMSTQILKQQAATIASNSASSPQDPPPGCQYVLNPECPAPPNPEPPHYCEHLVCSTGIPTLTPPEQPRKDTDTKLSCSTCLANGQTDICFNVKHGTSYCKRPQEIPESKDNETPENLDDRVSLNVLCIRCTAPSVTVTPHPSITCTPPPPCLNAVPRCLPPVPPGGWCPEPKPTCIPMPEYCKPGSGLGGNCPNPPPGGWCPLSPTPSPTGS